jgi:hypothetical protein
MAGTTTDPGANASAAPETPYAQSTFNYALRIWWAFYWPLGLATIVAFFVVAIIGGIIQGLRHAPPQQIILPVFGAAILCYFGLSFLVMYYILDKEFRHFRVALVSSTDYAHPQILPRTTARVGRVWFAYIWRAIVYGIVASFVASFPLSVITGPFVRMPAVFVGLKFATQIALSGAVGLFVLYNNIIDDRFGDVRVCLLRRDAALAPAAPAQANAAAAPAVS